MAALTFGITIALGKLRVRAVRQDGLKPSYFKYNQGGMPPEYLLRVEQHYNNLYETPVLFYTICLIGFLTVGADPLTVGLAWLYVASRIVHAYIHISTNKLLQRRRIFIVSVVILLSLWLTVLSRIVL